MHRFAIAALLAALAAPSAAVTVTFEKPGVLTSRAAFDVLGVETFDSRALGPGRSFTSSFGNNGQISGTYTGVRINAADVYGGADGTGRYAVTFDRAGYTLTLNNSDPRGTNYFGYWLSALDPNNMVEFYRNGTKLFTFSPADVLSYIGDKYAYRGNPGSPWENGNMRETYSFVNFFFDPGETFDTVHFWQAGGGGYESDNHTVGFYNKASGMDVETGLRIGTAVPEPTTWALMITGFLMVGWAARLQRRTPAVAA